MHYHDGNFTPSSSPLTTDVQKLITDLFALKFTDNTNTKLTDHHTDIGVLTTLLPFYTASGASFAPIFAYIPPAAAAPTAPANGPSGGPQHVPIAVSYTHLDVYKRQRAPRSNT